jgi:putative Mg2+ transporter-C (MgtC) family protein
MLSELEVVLRLILSAVIGGAIGIEREASNRPAGFRTHILVSVGSTLIMLVSAYGMGEGADPARLAAQVVSGIGFLGAGTILRTGNHIKGLTTAASLWVCAGIGLAIGAGFYLGGVVTAAIVLISLIALGNVEVNVLRGANKLVRVTATDRAGLIGDIGTVFGEYNISIRNVTIDDIKDDGEGPGKIEIKFYVKKPFNLNLQGLYDSLFHIRDIDEVDFEDQRVENWRNNKGGK